MALKHTTYATYGIRIPHAYPEETATWNLEEPLHVLLAGAYDDDLCYLSTLTITIEPGTVGILRPNEFEKPRFATWNAQLQKTVERLDIPSGECLGPAWFLIADVS